MKLPEIIFRGHAVRWHVEGSQPANIAQTMGEEVPWHLRRMWVPPARNSKEKSPSFRCWQIVHVSGLVRHQVFTNQKPSLTSLRNQCSDNVIRSSCEQMWPCKISFSAWSWIDWRVSTYTKVFARGSHTILSGSGAKTLVSAPLGRSETNRFHACKGGGSKTFEAQRAMWWHIWPNS